MLYRDWDGSGGEGRGGEGPNWGYGLKIGGVKAIADLGKTG